jgi:hypothetical protein
VVEDVEPPVAPLSLPECPLSPMQRRAFDGSELDRSMVRAKAPSGAQGMCLDKVARGTAAGSASALVPGETPIADGPRALNAISLPAQSIVR